MRKTLVFFCLFFFNLSHADVPTVQLTEIQHLLNFVKHSNCNINRNGSNHNGQNAAEHIEKKYHYFKDDIKTTEDFIKYSATKSTISGDYYMVTCQGQAPIKTQQWLLNELSHFRKNSKNTTTVCTEPRPQICTMEYLPVCATLKTQKTKTYASACSACADSNVVSHIPDKC